MTHRSTMSPLLAAFAVSFGLLAGCETLPGIKDNTVISSERGTLRVALRGDFSRLRTIQATLEDIDHVTIDIEGIGMAPQSQSLTRAELAAAGSSASLSFTDLPAGTITASLNAYDAANDVIGTASKTAAISLGQTTTIDLSVELVPTYVYETPPGSLAVNATLVDGPTITVRPGSIISVAGTGTYGAMGDGGIATRANLASPDDVVVDSSGNIYIADSNNNRVRKVTPGGTITTFAGTGTAGFSGDGGQAKNAQLNNPRGLAVDASDNLYIADTGNNRIRKVAVDGTITTIAGTGLSENPVDGTLATAAPLKSPMQLAFDNSGNLYITSTTQINRVTLDGKIAMVPGSLVNFPTDLVVDGNGNVYIAYAFQNKVMKLASGTMTTVAGTGVEASSGDGGNATNAALFHPVGITLDASGNLYIAESAGERVRKVTPGGTITTFAGTGTSGFSGDGGPAQSAQLSSPRAINLDKNGNFYIVELNRIRKIFR
ncbi:Serine/threonine-protein kinase PknD [compost metagenome]